MQTPQTLCYKYMESFLFWLHEKDYYVGPTMEHHHNREQLPPRDHVVALTTLVGGAQEGGATATHHATFHVEQASILLYGGGAQHGRHQRNRLCVSQVRFLGGVYLGQGSSVMSELRRSSFFLTH